MFYVVLCESSSGSRWLAGVYADRKVAEHVAAKLRPKWRGVEVRATDLWEPAREAHVE